MEGSLEIVHSTGESTGVVGTDWSDDAIPVVLRTLYGITDVKEAEPTRAATGRVPDGQWTGKTANNQTVTIRLWREIPFEETYAAQIGPGLVDESEG